MLHSRNLFAVLVLTILPMTVQAQQGKWQRFGWNPPTVSQKDTNGGTWTYFRSGSYMDSGIIMRPMHPMYPYRWNPYTQSENGFDFRLRFNFDFSLHYKNGLLQNYPLYYGPWIDPRDNRLGYRWPFFRSDTSSGSKYWRKKGLE